MNIKYSIRFLLFLWILAGISCYDDKGNYDYTTVNQTYVLEGIELSYNKSMGDVLEIIPTVVNSGDNLGDTSRYEYWWTAQREIYREGEDNTLHVIGRGVSLYYKIDLPKLSHEDRYLITFRMKDKESGIEWTYHTFLVLTGSYPEGWLLLCDNDGKAELNIYARKSDGSRMLIKNMLKNSGDPYLRGPKKVVYEPSQQGETKIWILTEDGATYLDRDNYLWNETQIMKYLMVDVVGDNYTCEDIINLGFLNTFQIMKDGEGIQLRSTMLKGGVYQGNIAQYQDGTRFSIAPYFGYGQLAHPLFSSVLLYDTDHQQFASCGAALGGGNVTRFCTALTPVETWKIGKKMLYMQNANASNTYALFEEEGSDDILQCKILFSLTGTTVNVIMDKKETLANATHLKNAKFRAYLAKTGYLYYVDGNTLYTWYDGQERPIQTFTEEVTALHSQDVAAFDPEAAKVKEYLLVATYSDRSDVEQEDRGTLYFYSTDGTAAINVREENRLSGVGKVVDMDYQSK